MKKTLLFMGLAMLLSSQLSAQTLLYGVSKNNNSLFVLDTTSSYNLIDTKELYSDFTGDTIVNSCYGLALSPNDNNMYIIYQPDEADSDTRRIGILDTVTAEIADIGISGNFVDIAFSGDQKLYATSGDNDGYNYYEINTTDGIATSLFSQTTGMYAPTIGYNYFTGQMWKFDYESISGIDLENEIDTIYESSLDGSNAIHGIAFKNDSIGIAVGYSNFYEYNFNSNTFEELESPFTGDMHGLSFGKLPLFIKVTGPSTFCANVPSELSASEIEATTYQWQLDGADIAGATAINYTPTVSGEYACVIDGETAKSVIITVLEVPEALFTANPEDILLGADLTGTVEFTNNSTGADNYNWDFDNGFTTTLESPSFPFTIEGIYEVTLIAWNSETTCSDTTNTAITVTNNVGIEEDITNEFKIYPIPSNDVINITPVLNNEAYSIQLITVNGQVIETKNIPAGTTAQFNLVTIESGFYFVKVKTKNYTAQYKIVKK